MEDKFTLIVNKSKTSGSATMNSSTTIDAGSLDEIHRMLELAGLKDEPTVSSALAAKGVVDSQIQDGEFEVVGDVRYITTDELSNNGSGCGCPPECPCHGQCKPGCGCDCSGEGYSNSVEEGWLENQFSNGSVDCEVCGPDDMVDVEFNTEDRKLGESDIAGEYDYGHTDKSKRKRRNDIAAFDYKGRPESGGSASFRYTKAGYADNPMRMEDDMDMDYDDEIGMSREDEDEQQYSSEMNLIVDTMKADIDNGSFTSVDNYIDTLALEFTKSEVEVAEELVDQFVLRYGKTPYQMAGMVQESVETGYRNQRLKESIGILANTESDEFMSALDKIKDDRVNTITVSEAHHLAAAFINIMRDSDNRSLVRLHECMREFITGGLIDEYRSYTKNKK